MPKRKGSYYPRYSTKRSRSRTYKKSAAASRIQSAWRRRKTRKPYRFGKKRMLALRRVKKQGPELKGTGFRDVMAQQMNPLIVNGVNLGNYYFIKGSLKNASGQTVIADLVSIAQGDGRDPRS